MSAPDRAKGKQDPEREMADKQRDLEWERPRMRSLIRLAVHRQKDRAVVKKIGRGWPKEWLKGVFQEVMAGEMVVWDYNEPSGELWVKKVRL